MLWVFENGSEWICRLHIRCHVVKCFGYRCRKTTYTNADHLQHKLITISTILFPRSLLYQIESKAFQIIAFCFCFQLTKCPGFSGNESVLHLTKPIPERSTADNSHDFLQALQMPNTFDGFRQFVLQITLFHSLKKYGLSI